MGRRAQAQARRGRLLTRGEKAIVGMIAVTAVAVPASVVIGQRVPWSSSDGPVVGSDLHAVAAFGERVYVSGHAGAGLLNATSTWEQIAFLDNKDAMAWVTTRRDLLVGGHAGLFRADQDGTAFAAAKSDLPVTDVHALGAAGDRVYLGSPQGFFVSEDGGRTFTRKDTRSGVNGTTFMGMIVVDPADPSVAIAADMQRGVVVSRDGGTSWRRLGRLGPAVSLAADPNDPRRLAAVSANGVSETSDGGRSWTSLDAPVASAAVSFDPAGRLLVASLDQGRADVYRRTDQGWQALG